MPFEYKVWIEIEEVDDDLNHYQTLDLPFASTASFDTEQEALAYATKLNQIGEMIE
jgi:hypothetical protein